MTARNVISVEGLAFTYPGRSAPTLRGVELEIREGEFVLITGPTGCGKSTLLKALNGIIPWESAGRMEGRVLIRGADTRSVGQARLCQKVGLVFQSPDDQLFATVVEDELAFGLENLRVPREEIGRRIRDALEMVDLGGMLARPTAALSGGQKQRVAIAAVLAMRPRILALDEPLSQLDPVGAAEVLGLLLDLNRRHGVTVVLVEHRVHEVAEMVDRIVVMADGAIALDASPREAFGKLELFRTYGLRVPETVELFSRLGWPERPLSAAEALPLLRERREMSRGREAGAGHATRPSSVAVRLGPGCPQTNQRPHHTYSANGQPLVVEAENIHFVYQRGSSKVLEDVGLAVRRGEVVALMGTNGSGKSTLLMHLCALLKPNSGTVRVLGRVLNGLNAYALAGAVGVVFQNPDLMLFSDAVREEVAYGPRNLGLPQLQVEGRTNEALAAMSISDLSEDSPLALSRGQRLRAAVASVLSMHPRLLLLDEPTTGQDKVHIETMMDHLTAEASRPTLVFCTHDVLTACRYADRIATMSGGRVVAVGSPRQVLTDPVVLRESSLRPPQSLLLSNELGLQPCLSTEDLVEALR